MIETLEQAEAVIARLRYPNIAYEVRELHIGTFAVTARLTADDINNPGQEVVLRMSTTITPGKSEFQFCQAILRLNARLVIHEMCENFLLDGERFQNTHIEGDLLAETL